MDGDRTEIEYETVNGSGCILAIARNGRKLQWLVVSICFMAWFVGYSAGDQILSRYWDTGHSRLLASLMLCIASTIPLLPILLDPPNNSSFVTASYLLACGILGAMAGGISMLYSSITYLLCSAYLVLGGLFAFLLLKHTTTSRALDSFIRFLSSAVVSGIRSSGTERPGRPSRSCFINLGFVFTILACTAIDGLLLPLADQAFQEFAGKENFTSQSFALMVAAMVCMVALFIDGDFGHPISENRHCRPENLGDWTTLICSAVAWQIFFLAILGFVFLASSLFSNVIITVKMPLVPCILLVMLFHEQLAAQKILSTLLVLWVLISYAT